jgi:ER-bound oxygenase mpaB/B'/Rubber oxygenase, catalytic domain
LIRRKHFTISKTAEKNNLAKITQYSMVITQFGFVGYALSRPQMLGIKTDNKEDREGFVHFWAVIGSMLGIKDEFNMCLHSLEVVEM